MISGSVDLPRVADEPRQERIGGPLGGWPVRHRMLSRSSDDASGRPRTFIAIDARWPALREAGRGGAQRIFQE
jgi:hypothetical protein